MKKAITFLFVCIALSANSQQKKTIEFSAHINSIDPLPPLGNFITSSTKLLGYSDFTNKSIAPGLTIKYFIKENCAVYLKGIYTNRDYKEYQDIVESTHQINENRTIQKIFRIAPGAQWSFMHKKVAFLGGFDLPLTFYGETVQNATTFNEGLDGSNKTNNHNEFKIPGGSSFGIGIFGGINYYFTKKFAVGFTLGSAYEYKKVGGIIKWASVTTGAITGEFSDSWKDTIKDLGFAPLQGSINITWSIK